MDATHIHLMLNHFPILGTLFGIGLLAYGIFAKNNSIKHAAFVLFVLIALISIPVFLTGEGAEETVENLPGVSERLIKEHEEFAEKAIWLMGALGILSLFNLYFSIKNKPRERIFSQITLVVALVTFGLMTQVGNIGGQIRHTEIRDASNEKLQPVGVDRENDND